MSKLVFHNIRYRPQYDLSCWVSGLATDPETKEVQEWMFFMEQEDMDNQWIINLNMKAMEETLNFSKEKNMKDELKICNDWQKVAEVNFNEACKHEKAAQELWAALEQFGVYDSIFQILDKYREYIP